MTSPDGLLSVLERDVLQEVMNIAFGRAASDLSDIIGLHVTLTVPHIDLLRFDQVQPAISTGLPDKRDRSMVKQVFGGRFSGSSILVFPHGEGRKLLRMFDESPVVAGGPGYDAETLERETLIEISNILMGACISKIAELLGDVVSYSPPRYYACDQIDRALMEAFASRDSFAIFFKTVFHFREFNASGCLFLVCDPATLDWLKKAIENYLNQYA